MNTVTILWLVHITIKAISIFPAVIAEAGEKMKSCRVDRAEQSIKEKLGHEEVKPHQKISKTRFLREMELLKKQKLSFFQDYKDKFMTREDYIVKKKK